MKMFISDGLFHADLHPGNIFFTQEGTIALLDFGMYGELSDEHRDHFILYWFAGLQRQIRRAFYHLKEADEDVYYETFKRVANSFYDSTITERSITQTYLDIIVSGAKFGFVFPSDLLLQAKALTTAEALAFTLTPDLKFDREARPIIAREFAQRAADLERLRAQAEQLLPELLLFGELLPASIREPSEVAERSLKALKGGRVIYIPGFKNRALVVLARSPLKPLLLKMLENSLRVSLPDAERP